MNIFYEEHRLILKTLLEAGVDFMLIGGYAVNYYGYNRSTGDMDIWLKPDNHNKERLVLALGKLGFNKADMAKIQDWDFTKAQKFRTGNEHQPDKTEFMTHISGIAYEEAQKSVITAELEGLALPMIHYNSLIQNKKSTGRLKDAADVEYLEKIMHLRNKKT